MSNWKKIFLFFILFACNAYGQTVYVDTGKFSIKLPEGYHFVYMVQNNEFTRCVFQKNNTLVELIGMKKGAPENVKTFVENGRMWFFSGETLPVVKNSKITLQDKFINGFAYHLGREYEKSNNLLFQVLKEEPNNPLLYNIIGKNFAGLGETKKCEEFLKKAIEINPNIAVYYGDLAHYYLRINPNHEEARKIIAAGLLIEKHWLLFYNQGVLFVDEKKWDDAENSFKNALAVAPTEYAKAVCLEAISKLKIYRMQQAILGNAKVKCK